MSKEKEHGIDNQKVEKVSNRICITRADYDVSAYTTYIEGVSESDDLKKEIESLCWQPQFTTAEKDNYYFAREKCGKKEYLHQLVFKHWYGEETLKAAYESGLVIDHINGNGYDCRLENLTLLSRENNSKKSRYFDKRRKASMRNVLIDIRRGYKSNCFQLNLVFNNMGTKCFVNNEVKEGLLGVNLLYPMGMPYEVVLNEAEAILDGVLNEGMVDISSETMSFINYRPLRPSGQCVEILFMGGFFTEVHPEEDWL